MERTSVTKVLFVSCALWSALHGALLRIPNRAQDAIPPSTVVHARNTSRAATRSDDFKYKFVALGGDIFDSQIEPTMLEVAATLSIPDNQHQEGAEIVSALVRDMADEVFVALATYASVGFFTAEEGTTVFPEYEQYRDRPECQGTCAGACSDTCTPDGRKYDELAGVGGERATCVNDNFMCLPDDPYYGDFSVLVHEFAHTLHYYALPYSTDLLERIRAAYNKAYSLQTWDITSYAMSNELEYFAEGAGVYFNVNFHPVSSGGMNSCGRVSGFCESEYEARSWLYAQDTDLYGCLLDAFLGGDPSSESGLTVCPE